VYPPQLARLRLPQAGARHQLAYRSRLMRCPPPSPGIRRPAPISLDRHSRGSLPDRFPVSALCGRRKEVRHRPYPTWPEEDRA
jgi:hypothetical protein